MLRKLAVSCNIVVLNVRRTNIPPDSEIRTLFDNLCIIIVVKIYDYAIENPSNYTVNETKLSSVFPNLHFWPLNVYHEIIITV